MLQAQLEYIDAMVPKHDFVDIDNRPKHLIHMSEEDLKPKSYEQ